MLIATRTRATPLDRLPSADSFYHAAVRHVVTRTARSAPHSPPPGRGDSTGFVVYARRGARTAHLVSRPPPGCGNGMASLARAQGGASVAGLVSAALATTLRAGRDRRTAFRTKCVVLARTPPSFNQSRPDRSTPHLPVAAPWSLPPAYPGNASTSASPDLTRGFGLPYPAKD
jgi:hypothetical protein